METRTYTSRSSSSSLLNRAERVQCVMISLRRLLTRQYLFWTQKNKAERVSDAFRNPETRQHPRPAIPRSIPASSGLTSIMHLLGNWLCRSFSCAGHDQQFGSHFYVFFHMGIRQTLTLPEGMDYKRFALVTGCGEGGIGQALAEHLLRQSKCWCCQTRESPLLQGD